MKLLHTKMEKTNPYLTANILSKATFWWMNGLFRLGYKRPLTSNDVYATLPRDKARTLSDKLHKEFYDKRLNKNADIGKNTLMKCLFTMFLGSFFVTGILAFIIEAIKITQPVLVANLVTYFDPLDNSTIVSEQEAVITGSVLAVSGFILSFPSIFYFYISQTTGMRMRAACSSLIYRKSLHLSSQSLASISTGKIVNLVSTDIEKFHLGVNYLHYLWLSPIEIGVVIYLLYLEVGNSCFAGLAVFVIMVPIQVSMGKVFGKFRMQIAQLTDKRILCMTEIISGMRVIKMYCWEKPFGKIVQQLRGNEIKKVRKTLFTSGQISTLVFLAPKLTSLVIMLTYYYTGNEIRPEMVVKVVSWTEQLRTSLIFISESAQCGTEMLASVSRIQEFLVLDEKPNVKNKITAGNPVHMHSVKATWKNSQEKTSDGFALRNIDISIQKGELIAIVGAVGSGKSSLLMTMMGEMPVKSGSVDLNGNVAYVPQEAWIFSGSIQDNVLFGKDLDENRYKDTLSVCALDKDVKLFENGDDTMVGEKGFSLSGGQKARINLARATYEEADVYLFDDPLSAVDASVGKHIFQKCICRHLKSKTRILVTHQLQFLSQVDKIYVLSEGRIIASGTFNEVNNHLNMAKLLSKKDDKEDTSRHMLSRSMSALSQHSTVSSVSDLAVDNVQQSEQCIQNDKATLAEVQTSGSIGVNTFVQYYGAGYGIVLVPVTLMLAILSQLAFNASDYLLTEWHNYQEEDDYVYIYIGVVIGLILVSSIRSFTFFTMTTLSSRNLHNTMFDILLRTPISFFDIHPVGQVLNRFARDMGFMDELLPKLSHMVLMYLLSFMGTIVFVSVANPWTLVITFPMVIGIFFLRQYALKSAIPVKRIEAASRSPMYTHLSATLQGLPVIRSFRMEESFINKAYNHQDNQTNGWFLYLSTYRWFGQRLDWSVSLYFAGCIIAAFFLKDADGGAIGISLTYITGLLGSFQYIMRQTAEVESLMTSVERILEYTKLEQEAEEHTSVKPDQDWPSQGNIHFDSLCLSYSSDKPVLKDINVVIKSKEKIGVVGRTGAGKTSLLSCLFRLSEPGPGTIWIDGINISEIGLTDLRQKISIIPQDPVLFSGTVRYNLDPFSQFTDEELWKSLQQAHLANAVRSFQGGLQANIAEAGSNFSVGQRQLVCLARAILRNNKILIIDEATANVDLKTDELIQTTLRTRFSECTVLTIAHRLNTIIDSDKVLVLDQGEVSQFDQPYSLLQDKEGIFYNLVQQTGTSSAQNLLLVAKNAYIADDNVNTLHFRQQELCQSNITEISPENSDGQVSTAYVNIGFVAEEHFSTDL